ncbi:hypothetical protein D3C87_1086230 [compost metagenome]
MWPLGLVNPWSYATFFSNTQRRIDQAVHVTFSHTVDFTQTFFRRVLQFLTGHVSSQAHDTNTSRTTSFSSHFQMWECILRVVDAIVDHLQRVVRYFLLTLLSMDVVLNDSSQRASSNLTLAVVFFRMEIFHRIVRRGRLADFQTQVRRQDRIEERSMTVDLRHVRPVSCTSFDAFVQCSQYNFTSTYINFLKAWIFLVFQIQIDELTDITTVECFM